jgi:hypothetical protein
MCKAEGSIPALKKKKGKEGKEGGRRDGGRRKEGRKEGKNYGINIFLNLMSKFDVYGKNMIIYHSKC